MSDLISRQDAIYALLEKGQRSRRYKLGEIWELNFDEIREALATVPSAEPVKNELVADFVDTAEKAAKVEIMSEKDAQVTLDAWRMHNHISEAKHE